MVARLKKIVTDSPLKKVSIDKAIFLHHHLKITLVICIGESNRNLFIINLKILPMKITIEFDEADDAKLAMEAFDWKHTVLQLDQLLRSTTKHGVYQGREASTEELDMADYLREQIREFANDNNLTI
jgi:hypothetical protein